MHNSESVKLLYLPGNRGCSGLKSVEDTYKHIKIKMANYIDNCKDKRVQVVRAHKMRKISKNRKSLFKDANRYPAEYNLTCEFNNTNTILKDIHWKTTQINSQSPHAIKTPSTANTAKEIHREHERKSMAKYTNEQTT